MHHPLKLLTHRQRAVCLLRYGERLPHSVIAQRLAIKKCAVTRRLGRARQTLVAHGYHDPEHALPNRSTPSPPHGVNATPCGF